MFTDRFLKVPIRIYSVKEQELTGNAQEVDSWLKFNPMDISYYKPTLSNEDSENEITYLILKNGAGFMVYLTPTVFEKLLNDFVK